MYIWAGNCNSGMQKNITVTLCKSQKPRLIQVMKHPILTLSLVGSTILCGQFQICLSHCCYYSLISPEPSKNCLFYMHSPHWCSHPQRKSSKNLLTRPAMTAQEVYKWFPSGCPCTPLPSNVVTTTRTFVSK